MERSKAGMKEKEVPTAYHQSNENTIINNILFKNIWKNYDEIQLIKK